MEEGTTSSDVPPIHTTSKTLRTHDSRRLDAISQYLRTDQTHLRNVLTSVEAGLNSRTCAVVVPACSIFHANDTKPQTPIYELHDSTPISRHHTPPQSHRSPTRTPHASSQDSCSTTQVVCATLGLGSVLHDSHQESACPGILS